MWCRRVRNQLSAYVDGELTLADARVVEEHLAHCELCARERNSLQTLASLAAVIPEEDLPLGLHSRIMMGVSYVGSGGAPAASVAMQRSPFLGPWLYTALTGAAVTGA